jgi:hypothetical protein
MAAISDIMIFGLKLYLRLTPSLEAGTKWFDKLTILSRVEGPVGFPPWSRGPLLHRGEKRQLFHLVEHGDSNPVFDIT